MPGNWAPKARFQDRLLLHNGFLLINVAHNFLLSCKKTSRKKISALVLKMRENSLSNQIWTPPPEVVEKALRMRDAIARPKDYIAGKIASLKRLRAFVSDGECVSQRGGVCIVRRRHPAFLID